MQVRLAFRKQWSGSSSDSIDVLAKRSLQSEGCLVRDPVADPVALSIKLSHCCRTTISSSRLAVCRHGHQESRCLVRNGVKCRIEVNVDPVEYKYVQTKYPTWYTYCINGSCQNAVYFRYIVRPAIPVFTMRLYMWYVVLRFCR